jgi:hypothetical protein
MAMNGYVAGVSLAQIELAPIHWFLLALAGILVVVGAVWIISEGVARGMRSASPHQPNTDLHSPPGGFPVLAETDGPGKFRITGVDQRTSLDVTDYITADSAANAKVKAELRGIVVTKIDRV